MENILNSNIPVISIIVSAVIGIGCAFSIYKSLKTKGFTSIKTIKKFAKELVNNEEIINIISEVFTCVDIDISKYNSKYELLSDQLDKVEDKLYIYLKSSKDISPIIKKVITRDNISAVSDYIMNKMGFDTDLILSNYDSLKKKHGKELEEKSKTKVVEENVEENNNTEGVETSENVEETVETELIEEELTLGEFVETSEELEETVETELVEEELTLGEAVETSEEVEETVETELTEEELTLGEAVETDKLVEEGNSENDETKMIHTIRSFVPTVDGGLKELENTEVSENESEIAEEKVEETLIIGKNVDISKTDEEEISENDEITENPIKERIRLVVPTEDGLKELENIEVSENDNENIENDAKEEIEKVEDKTEEKKKKKSTKKRKKKTTKKEK